MIKKIIKSLKDGTIFKKVKNRISCEIFRIYDFIFGKNKTIENNKIFIMTFQGNYTCNPKALVEYIIENKLPYKIVWAVREDDLKHLNEFPADIQLVKRNSLKFYKEISTSKIIIDNSTNYIYLKAKKRDGQYIIQTWHGSMGFKKIEPSSFQDKDWVNKAMKLDKYNDYILVNSSFEEDVFRNSFWKTTEFLKVGHPRNDIFFDKKKMNYFSKTLREKYNLEKNTKIVLYAPTFRENISPNDYNIDYNKLHDALVKRFGGKWVIFVRFHFRMNYLKIENNEHVINVTDYPDMQELLCACDIGITDYSSWLCDFVLTKKPGFLYTYDINKYVDERGFYYPLSSSPFKVCNNNDELCNNIINYNEKDYLKDVNEYLKRLGCYEEGKACEKTIELIEQLCKK